MAQGNSGDEAFANYLCVYMHAPSSQCYTQGQHSQRLLQRSERTAG